MERLAGFEPVPSDWKSEMLTVKHYSRKKWDFSNQHNVKKENKNTRKQNE